ncbi:hypothetical protein SmJEL517_g03338 [Synchytrium microbalum]|uniref:Pirin N-terminal domain-containing protein n=1 Tax=Synchytrium microbalum TaxID=1806994 RepID=A0A507C463_9FUNG|nr:uncharacterized protein SmJEL517_g03338 [Synchytrium microbalum]TPX33879.1 hypothetical protein SmJEL517_g03338 [Synchytrium microbalum]
MAQHRPVLNVIKSGTFREGGGFQVRRPFPTHTLSHVDPFLLIDHLGPVTYGPGQAVGAPDHPHRGFITVSYLLHGEMKHRDSAGNSGKLSPGDVQWMRAGSGIVHSEMPSDEFDETGGLSEGFQIWINLKAEQKFLPPLYQEFKGSKIPKYEKDGVWANVIAGNVYDLEGIVVTDTPTVYVHVILQAGASFSYNVPHALQNNFNVMCYIASGEGYFGGDPKDSEGTFAKEADLVQFSREDKGAAGNDSSVVVYNLDSASKPLSFLLLGGQPLDEPVVRYGPFVMNTREQIQQAFLDYDDGKMGLIKATVVS